MKELKKAIKLYNDKYLMYIERYMVFKAMKDVQSDFYSDKSFTIPQGTFLTLEKFTECFDELTNVHILIVTMSDSRGKLYKFSYLDDLIFVCG